MCGAGCSLTPRPGSSPAHIPGPGRRRRRCRAGEPTWRWSHAVSDSGGQDVTEINTSNDIAVRAYQLMRSRSLADVLTLSGVQCGAGDIYEALGRLALRLSIARDFEHARLDGLTDEQHRLDDIFHSHLTDTRNCPKCGARLTRIKDKGDRWYHKRPDWGWRRACL